MEKDNNINIKAIIDLNQKKYNELGEENLQLTDDQFDGLVSYYENKTGENYNAIGYKPDSDAVKLSIVLPSLDKATEGKNAQKELEDFIAKKKGGISSYVITDKLDGNSILLEYDSKGDIKAFSRGDGEYGQDISHILEYITVPRELANLKIRGELICHKDVFERIRQENIVKGKMKKIRNFVNGCIGRKIGREILCNCVFYAYEIIEAACACQENQLSKLVNLGFNIPEFKVVDGNFILESFLRIDYLKSRKELAPYEMDGIVITENISYKYSDINVNPSYKIAFKINTVVVTKVKNIRWQCKSRYGYLTPIVEIDEVNILGSDVNNLTGNNAQWLYDHHLGIDALIEVTVGGDIIPTLVSVLYGSDNYPPISFDCKWSTKGNCKELMLNDTNIDSVHINNIYSFFNILGVKYLGRTTVDKIYTSTDIRSIDKFLKMKPDEIINVEKLGLKSATKITDNIKKCVMNTTYPVLMRATGIFGEGIAENFCERFISAFPDWNLKVITENEILKIDGFGPVLSKQFADNLETFKYWFWNHPQFHYLENIEELFETSIVKNMVGEIVVFSGVRSTELEKELQKRGAQIKSSFVKATTILIVKDKNSTSSKVEEARKKEIKIFTIDEIKIMYGIKE